MQHLPSPLFHLIMLHLYIMQHNKALYFQLKEGESTVKGINAYVVLNPLGKLML